ncbi:hypothetical protein GN156_04630 [bacterium LRH843]|nr:hypothetical protein [bacterium LRH843]
MNDGNNPIAIIGEKKNVHNELQHRNGSIYSAGVYLKRIFEYSKRGKIKKTTKSLKLQLKIVRKDHIIIGVYFVTNLRHY